MTRVLVALAAFGSAVQAQPVGDQGVMLSGAEPPGAAAPSKAPDEAPDEASVRAVVSLFRDACIVTEAQPAAALDWALGRGFEPADGRDSADDLFAGQASTVLAMPGSAGRVLLVTSKESCSVWVEQMSGPPLRWAMSLEMSRLSSRGARVQGVLERHVERAGAWRQQTQWRYRRVGGSHDIDVGIVTTLTDTPGTQLLHAAPAPTRPAYAPDGVPTDR